MPRPRSKDPFVAAIKSYLVPAFEPYGFKLRGKGIPSLNSTQRGDLMVRVLVEVPTRLNAEQRRKLEEFAELMGDDNTPLHRSFFDKAKEFFK